MLLVSWKLKLTSLEMVRSKKELLKNLIKTVTQ